VLMNQNSLAFSAPITRGPYAGNPVAVTTGDFDDDGLDDVATTLSPPWPDGPLSISRGLGDGSTLAPTSFLAGYSALSLATGDFDADGRDDLVSGIYQERRIRVWLNRAVPSVSADRNNDGVPDECDCPADFDGTGFVDTDDYDAFVRAFEIGGDDADFNNSGFVDLEDFVDFVHAFEAGC
ncbi:MAG: VCBS repeat-containing protein, partial [Phycisphaerales bacterium]|nr:VCBS repeat-containing protein [Phycisphaerales bacterium]